jgi:hypothetical protein
VGALTRDQSTGLVSGNLTRGAAVGSGHCDVAAGARAWGPVELPATASRNGPDHACCGARAVRSAGNRSTCMARGRGALNLCYTR